MTLAIMQPYFFPYIGYYSLIKYSDRFIVFDTPQFIYHGWIERNRILKPLEGWQYVNVPLIKHSRSAVIKDVLIRKSEPWQEKMIAQLQHYKKKAPFFKSTMEIIEQIIFTDIDSIAYLNVKMLELTCSYLGIDLHYNFFSKMDIVIEDVNEPDEWALNISKAIGATEYANPPGGKEIFNKKKYNDSNVKLTFLKNKLNPYNQNRETFEAGLSIIDVMMFNSKEEIIKMLDDYEII
jgi:hypothetical protein